MCLPDSLAMTTEFSLHFDSMFLHKNVVGKATSQRNTSSLRNMLRRKQFEFSSL